MTYIVIGGIPVSSFTGTITFSGLEVVGVTEDRKEVEKIVKEKFDECRGLLIVVDSNGKVV